MFVELQVALFERGSPSVVLVALTQADVGRLRAGEELSVLLRDVGLHLYNDETATLSFALGGEKRRGRFVLSEGMLRDHITLSAKFAELDFANEGRVVLFLRATNDETAAALRGYAQRLARANQPDDSVVNVYRLDRATGHVSHERHERGRPSPSGPQSAPLSAILITGVGAIGAVAGAVRAPTFSTRALLVAIALFMAFAAGWNLHLRRRSQ